MLCARGTDSCCARLQSSALDERWKTDLVEFTSEFVSMILSHFPQQVCVCTHARLSYAICMLVCVRAVHLLASLCICCLDSLLL